jgi:hypothetical protein
MVHLPNLFVVGGVEVVTPPALCGAANKAAIKDRERQRQLTTAI